MILKVYLFVSLFLTPSAVIRVLNASNGSECTVTMFGGDVNAFWACTTERALQSNWWPSPIAGLFSYQEWNGYDGFWQDGALLEALANFKSYANNTRYMSVLKSSYREIYELKLAYAPYPSFDDMAWYALSYIRIYEVTGWPEFLDVAQQIFDFCWTSGWDSSGNCGGGMWFDNNRNSKQTITNVQMLVVGAKLHRLTKRNDTQLLDKVMLVWRYILKNGLVDTKTMLISDGARQNCTADGNYNPTYNQGVFVGALVELWKLLRDPQYLSMANAVANATITLKSVNGTLTEWCDFQVCNDDTKMYKGIFTRNLRYLMDAPGMVGTTAREQYSQWLNHNILSVLENNICYPRGVPKTCHVVYKDGPPFNNCTGPVFSENWHGPYNYTAPMQQTSVLELFTANIKLGTLCKGDACAYDPPTPAPHPLTCKDDPCPPGQDCCSYGGSYTCCDSDQQCKNHVCV
ncbi:uncharacterized protein LOC121374585 [Gigantopelta aegis]|uniref:uncharacterized protein LOC121374585 n=1 Tax=Gigantopelta aegis TaxID=1735272 RepID=UPI001B88DF4E|nr:uncharacterized protein LOC121374585 [Gigantopelta aegis]